MKTLIAVPCMDMVHTGFMRSLLALKKSGEVEYMIPQSTLIYDARNMIAQKAVSDGFDRVLWLDSDMTFSPDLMEKLGARIDEGHDMVTGVYYTRKPPHHPVLFNRCRIENVFGMPIPDTEIFSEYPADLFEVEGCGFGCVMTTTELLDAVMKEFGLFPFYPQIGFGEDLAFCLRVRELGRKIMCDGTIQCGHVGHYEYGRKDAEEGEN